MRSRSGNNAPFQWRGQLSAKELLLTLTAMMASCLLAGCGGRGLPGRWQMADRPEAPIWEFRDNGAVNIGTEVGRYSFGDNARLKIETRFATSVYQLELTGDRMTLRDVRGGQLVFTRLK